MISIGVRGLKIIETFNKRVISLDGKKFDPAEKEKVKGFELRFLVRRAHAYVKTGQYHSGRLDM